MSKWSTRLNLQSLDGRELPSVTLPAEPAPAPVAMVQPTLTPEARPTANVTVIPGTPTAQTTLTVTPSRITPPPPATVPAVEIVQIHESGRDGVIQDGDTVWVTGPSASNGVVFVQIGYTDGGPPTFFQSVAVQTGVTGKYVAPLRDIDFDRIDGKGEQLVIRVAQVVNGTPATPVEARFDGRPSTGYQISPQYRPSIMVTLPPGTVAVTGTGTLAVLPTPVQRPAPVAVTPTPANPLPQTQPEPAPALPTLTPTADTPVVVARVTDGPTAS